MLNAIHYIYRVMISTRIELWS